MKKTPRATKDSRNPRPLLYVYVSPDEPRCYWIYGISFAEFFEAMRLRCDLVLLSKDFLDPCEEDPVTRFNLVERAKLEELANLDLYAACGDFIWVDLESSGPRSFTRSLQALRRLSKRDIARLLYLGHTFQPWGSPFFAGLGNRFAYLAHDDSWLLRLYARDSRDVIQLLEGVVRSKTRHFLSKNFKTRGWGRKLLRWAGSGIACDFRGGDSVRLLQPGRFQNMDLLLDAIKAGKYAVLGGGRGLGRE